MPIAAGTRLGPYEVVSPLGAGGMGEVWKGRDSRLDRSVAIKVLPEAFAENAQLKLRFEREAKTISQLNHPHICTLYDVGDGYLVMELLEGESLDEKLSKGPLPIDQVLRYGIEIAEALEKAHKAGVVHRDLKPGNIMITKTGAKLLDFGLAKPASVFEADGATQHKSLTQEGTIVGTFQYMAPEQIEGGAVDSRTDIFALGAVLYEMATGRRAFEGKSKASLIASILTADPGPISAIQPMMPVSLDRLIRACLQKDPDQRLQSAHDVAQALRWVSAAEPMRQSQDQGRRSRALLSALVLLLLASIASGVALWRDRTAHSAEPVVRTLIESPPGATFDFRNSAAPPAISPDGRRVVFGAIEAGKTRILWLRSLDSLAAQPLIGTEGAMFPFWSPDGRSIAFFTDTALKKMEVNGGAPVVLCSVIDGRGGSWSPDGRTIIFAGRYTPIYRVASAGGAPVEVTRTDARSSSHRWPQFLPDSRRFLYLATIGGSDNPENTICAGSLDGKLQKTLLSRAQDPHYYSGHLLFVRDRTLTAQAVRLRDLTLSGDAFPLKEQQVETTDLFSKSFVTIASNGTLIYQNGRGIQPSQLTWFDRSGKNLGPAGDPGMYSLVSISPDEKSALISLTPSPQSNIWMIDFGRGLKRRVTFRNAFDTSPVWAPDGRRFAYSSFTAGHYEIVLRDVATGTEEVLTAGSTSGTAAISSWSADGKIFYSLTGKTSRSDIWWISIGERKPHLYLGTPFVETGARSSPDGKWVAYQSNESGTLEIYVAPFPPTGAKWQVSSGGGTGVRWRSDGKELFYAVPGNQTRAVAVPILLGATPWIEKPVTLFSYGLGYASPGHYDVSRDGQRLLVNTRIGDELPPAPLIVVQHLDKELRAAEDQRN